MWKSFERDASHYCVSRNFYTLYSLCPKQGLLKFWLLHVENWCREFFYRHISNEVSFVNLNLQRAKIITRLTSEKLSVPMNKIYKKIKRSHYKKNWFDLFIKSWIYANFGKFYLIIFHTYFVHLIKYISNLFWNASTDAKVHAIQMQITTQFCITDNVVIVVASFCVIALSAFSSPPAEAVTTRKRKQPIKQTW